MSISLNFPFDTPGNYIYGTKVKDPDGNASLKDQRPANATFHAELTDILNADWLDCYCYRYEKF